MPVHIHKLLPSPSVSRVPLTKPGEERVSSLFNEQDEEKGGGGE